MSALSILAPFMRPARAAASAIAESAGNRIETLRDSANLDFLRAIAVLCVYFDHLFTVFNIERIGPFSMYNLGRGGVLLFFVHTSLVLMMSMERLSPRTSNLVLDFYTRRFFRIYPLSIVFVLATAVFRIPQASWRSDYHWPGIGHFLSNLALTQNLTFSASVLAPLWSLPLEVQMYVLLPFIYIVITRKDSLWMTLAAWCVAVAVAIVQPRYVARATLAGFIPCFLGGIIAFQVARRKCLRLPFSGWPVLIAAFLAAYTFTDKPYQLPPGWVLCLALGFAVPQFRELRSRVVRRASHLIAKYSYGIYLSHVVAMWISFNVMSGLSPLVQWATLAVLSVAMPVCAYHFVEHPLIVFGGELSARRWRLNRGTVAA